MTNGYNCGIIPLLTYNKEDVMKKLIRIFLWIMVFVTMSTIFYFSHQPAKKSSKTSHTIAKKIVNTVSKNKTQKEKKKLEKKVNDTLRTLAHFSLYFILGLFLMSAMIMSFGHKKSFVYLFVLTMILILMYALSDEYHQSFIPGRTAQAVDIAVDFAGGLLSSGIIFAVCNFKKKSI